MKKNSIKLLIIGTAFASVLSGCGDGWFERDPKNILTNEQVWNDQYGKVAVSELV